MKERTCCFTGHRKIDLLCNNHYEKWSKKDKKKYFKIEKQSDKKVYITDKYYTGCMQKKKSPFG